MLVLRGTIAVMLARPQSLTAHIPFLSIEPMPYHARGRYSRVIVTRLDFNWLAPHPPLDMLSSTCTYVPGGEDYGGINDRHAVMNREHAVHYLRRWDDIVSGRIMDAHPALRAGELSTVSMCPSALSMRDCCGWVRLCPRSLTIVRAPQSSHQRRPGTACSLMCCARPRSFALPTAAMCAARSGVIKYLTGERALATILRHYRVPVCRFPPIAHLACCRRSSDTSTSGNATAKVSDRCHNPGCYSVRVASLVPRGNRTHPNVVSSVSLSRPKAQRGKYIGEMRSSLLCTVASLKHTPASQHMPSSLREFAPHRHRCRCVCSQHPRRKVCTPSPPSVVRLASAWSCRSLTVSQNATVRAAQTRQVGKDSSPHQRLGRRHWKLCQCGARSQCLTAGKELPPPKAAQAPEWLCMRYKEWLCIMRYNEGEAGQRKSRGAMRYHEMTHA